MKTLPNINKPVPQPTDPALIQPVSDAIEAVDQAIGAKPSTLATTAKTIVPAVNELKDKVDTLEANNSLLPVAYNPLGTVAADYSTQGFFDYIGQSGAFVCFAQASLLNTPTHRVGNFVLALTIRPFTASTQPMIQYSLGGAQIMVRSGLPGQAWSDWATV